MNIIPVVTVAPATEPITTAEAKSFLRVDSSDDDTLIGDLITAARQYVESIVWRSLITQTLRLDLRGFPDSGQILLPRPPLVSVTSIYYTDSDGNSTEWTEAGNWVIDDGREPAIIERDYSISWPTVRSSDEIKTVQVTYVAGYGAASAVPGPIKQAIYLALAEMYDNRLSEESPQFSTVDRLLAPYKVRY